MTTIGEAERFYMNSVADVLHRTEARRRSARTLGRIAKLPNGVPFKFMGRPVAGPQCVTVSLVIDDLDLDTVMGQSERFAFKATSQFARVYRDLGAVRVEFTLPRSQWRDVQLSHLPHHREQVTIGQKALGPVARLDWVNPHKAIFGSTQTGKTTVLADMVISLARTDPQATETKLLILNPKNDPAFAAFARLPHLVAPIATTYEGAVTLLRLALREMDQRRREQLPYQPRWVVIIDEVAQLTAAMPESGPIITQLSQMAGGLKINLIVASQAANPSTFGQSGSLAQANFQSRLVFQLPHAQAYLATNLAGQHPEKLGGLGDGLAINGDKVTRFRAALPNPIDYEQLPRIQAEPPMPAQENIAGDSLIVENWQVDPHRLAYALVINNSATAIQKQFGGATQRAMQVRDYARLLNKEADYWLRVRKGLAA